MKPAMPLLLRGDARALPLGDASVDLVCCSPPYFGLRDYGADGQIGAESTPGEFIAALIECTREMARVLKPSGSIFVNLGDKYSGAGRGNNTGSALTNPEGMRTARLRASNRRQHLGKGIIPAKSLMMLPERYRIAAVDELGLIARAVIVWSKPNGLPESVTDRVRRSHEDWVHLVKSPRYFAAVDEIREPAEGRPGQMTWEQRKARGDAMRQGEQRGTFGDGMAANPLGKLPGSVWTIPTQPLNVPAELGVDHFAAYPAALVRPIILGWSPREVCTVCGEGRAPVADRSMGPDAQGRMGTRHGGDSARLAHSTERKMLDGLTLRTITGYACACPDTSAPATPGVVLDPFGGTATTALVATMLGRTGIGVELNPDYIRLARWRAADPKERARAAGLDPDQVSAIKPQLPGQIDIFGEEATA